MSSGRPHNLKTEQFDMDSFFDFNQGTSPVTASSSKMDATPKTASQDWNNVNPFDQEEQRQRFNGPSHDYNLHKQQVGLPMGSMHNVPMQNSIDGYNSGFGDMTFDGGMGGFNSGIDLDADMNMDFNNPQSAMPPMFFPPPNSSSQADNFVDPTSIGGDEPTSNVGRLWPGMHSQQAHQAAMAKAAQVQQVQQRQMKIQAQHAQYRQAADGLPRTQAGQPSNGKRPSHVTEPHVEESISRLLSQMRQNNHVSPDDETSPSGGMLPHIARMKKDEDDMDEDERLLASEDGKKLSSKERRQLRNKVSARAFRSRRKGKHIARSCSRYRLTDNTLQNTLASWKAKLLSRPKRAPPSATRTRLSCRRTSGTAASSRPSSATLPSRLSSRTSATIRLCLHSCNRAHRHNSSSRNNLPLRNPHRSNSRNLNLNLMRSRTF